MKIPKDKSVLKRYISSTLTLLGDVATISIKGKIYGPFDVESTSRIVKNVLEIEEEE